MILGVCGSGRRRGNSARLLEEAFRGAKGEARTIDLAEIQFRGCIGCRACRQTSDQCVLRDDLTDVLSSTASADALVMAAPIYYGYPSGLFKSYLDRWYSFRDGERRLRVPEGRPALLILTQGHPDTAAYSWTVGSLQKTLTAYGFRPTVFVAPGLEGEDDASARPELLSEAARLGGLL